MDFEKLLYGGSEKEEIKDSPSTSSTASKVEIVGEKSVMETYYPKITRDTLSVFEYVGVITKLAKYLSNIPDIEKYVSDVEVNQLINPAELAFNLLNEGKFDAVLDRGYEKVSFSKLKVKPQWKDMITNYFKTHHDSITNEVLKMLDNS